MGSLKYCLVLITPCVARPHTHPHAQTQTHPQTNARIHKSSEHWTRLQTLAQAHSHGHDTGTRTCSHTYTHVLTLASTCSLTHAYTYTLAPTHIPSGTHKQEGGAGGDSSHLGPLLLFTEEHGPAFGWSFLSFLHGLLPHPGSWAAVCAQGGQCAPGVFR